MKYSNAGGHCTLGSGEVCRILGISRDTLYAYVSRGLVRTAADPNDARRSLYDRRDIDTLMARQSRGRSRRSVAESTIHWGEPVLRSNITRIADGQFSYRGQNAVTLAQTQTLEDIAKLLARVSCKPLDKTTAIEPARNPRPYNRIITMMTDQVTSPESGDGRPRAGKIMRLTAMSAAGVNRETDAPIHQSLANAWSTDPRAADLIRRALVLCADHELNASAYAARVAASAGASLPAALLAGLATLSGNLHGGITAQCRDWMDDIDRIKASGNSVPIGTNTPPGFGHPLYPEGDPRTKALVQASGISEFWKQRIAQIHQTTGQHPSLDFALAHLERCLKMPVGSGLGIFAVGRTVGWIAHIFEQRETGRLIRPRAVVDDQVTA
ncbi:MAG: helix-turn-helix domain-containing protein [Alphaproteobacteria bacterium]|nr:helix-turn-helix domain-containing protein [Alphaproteobacteria bacterium]